MNSFQINLKNIQHIKSLDITIDLSLNTLHCIIGKNSVGKTTLIKAIENFKKTDTLYKLTRLNILKDDSSIEYKIDNNLYLFKVKKQNNTNILDFKNDIPQKYKNSIHTELPMPYDIRTKVYKKFDEDFKSEKSGSHTYKIQSKFATEDYSSTPQELINILNFTYETNKFNNIKQINISKDIYYIRDFNNFYLREDDFSSGEYMIVQLYKLIQNKTKMIVIDEIDISLDSSAQVRFIRILKCLCKKHKINIVFTTHSLAIMKKIDQLGLNLIYMENNKGDVSLKNRSYNFIKAELFQFTGYDKIILTEDEILVNYLNFILNDEKIYKKYRIIKCKSESETILIKRTNDTHNIFGTKNLKIVLDGDIKSKYKNKDIFNYIEFTPFDDIEVEILELYKNNIINNDPSIRINIDLVKEKDRSKQLFKALTQKKYTKNQLFHFINKQNKPNIDTFKENIVQFLNN